MYYLLPEYVLATTPKCASTSIREYCAGKYPGYSRGGAAYPDGWDVPVLLFVRDPWERFVSAYNTFYKMPGNMINWQGFVDAVLGGKEDHHWMPQKDYHTWAGKFHPTKLYPFEAINDVIPDLPHEHKGDRVPIDAIYRREEILDFYKEDFWLRAEVL